MSDDNPTLPERGSDERTEAYRRMREASDKLDDAARCLGFDDCDDLSLEAYDIEMDHRTEEAIKALTNAHSYLNNGQIEMLLGEEEERL